MNIIYTIVVAMLTEEDRKQGAIREAEIVVPESINTEDIATLVHNTMSRDGHPVLVTGILEYKGTGPVRPLFTVEMKADVSQETATTPPPSKVVKQA